MRKLLTIILCFIIPFLLITFDANARRGCCSNHGGVSHCNDGVLICNDGASSSCGCKSSSYQSSTSSESDSKINFDFNKKSFSYDCQTMVTTSKALILTKPSLINQKIQIILPKNHKVIKTDVFRNMMKHIMSTKKGFITEEEVQKALVKNNKSGFQNGFFEVNVIGTNIRGWIHKSVCSCL